MSTRKRTREDAGLVGNLEQVPEALRESKKRRVNEEVPQMIAFLEALHVAKHPDIKKRKKKENIKNYHSLEMKAFVVWLRYGSLAEVCEPPLRTFKEIFRITGVKVNS